MKQKIKNCLEHDPQAFFDALAEVMLERAPRDQVMCQEYGFSIKQGLDAFCELYVNPLVAPSIDGTP